MTNDRKTILIVSQVFSPDPTSVGQHLADTAFELAARGHRVVVLTSRRGYDDPSVKYPFRETLNGVAVIRLPFSSFGKRWLALRTVAAVIFLSLATVVGLFVHPLDIVLVSTSPPFASAAGVVIATLRRKPLKYWVMDLNPDQMIALGLLSPTSVVARLVDRLNVLALKRANSVIVPDRMMALRVNAKVDVHEKLAIVPPWAHEDQLIDVPHDQNRFRHEHGLDGKFVVMYSGNHSPSNPLATILDAAARLRDEPDLVFVFIGSGAGKRAIEQYPHDNVVSLPYQPLADLRYSLSAADVHIVSIGNPMVGVIHPCKVYGAMAIGRPVIVLGPSESPLAELLSQSNFGWRVSHGDVEAAERLLRTILLMPRADLAELGATGRKLLAESFSKQALCGAVCDAIVGDPAGSFRTTRN